MTTASTKATRGLLTKASSDKWTNGRRKRQAKHVVGLVSLYDID